MACGSIRHGTMADVRRVLPTGTVTFLFTDVEGSTRLLHELGTEAYAEALAEHRRIVREAVTAHGGVEVDTQGDSFFVAFSTAPGALAAAADAQKALATGPIRVRIGIHTGTPLLSDDDYVGADVHRAARIAAAGHGGQVLVSATTAALAGTSRLGDLGSHRLKDLSALEHIFQLGEGDFPPLKSLHQTNLPVPATSFLGRDRELAELTDLLTREEVRLVTLTGPGGTGKTRLSLATAAASAESYPDGVWFVALDAVRDPQLLIPTIAQTLGEPEQPGRPISATLADRLADGETLLVLDNLEQIIDAAPDIASLLRATASLSVCASSREPLSIAGERVYPVPPLAIPAESDRPTAADLKGSGSIELFVERARAARPDFALTDENAPAIAAICRRLDGLPLAIELAAARLNVLAPNQILSRLDDRLSFLASTRRDLPDRQRTLRGTIGWSHDLLSDGERAVFRRLSVFTGGADLESVQAVVDPEHELGEDVLDLVTALVDRSLVRSTHEGGIARLAMLETIREYAAERLADSGEMADLETRHAARYMALAESAATVMTDPRRDELLDQFDRDLGNLRAAIAWSVRSGHTDIGLRLTTALNDFWHLRNHIAEAVRALEDLLEASVADGVTVLRGRATLIAAGLLTWLADSERSRPLAEQGIAMAEQLGDVLGLALGKSSLGWSIFYTEPELALGVFEEGVAAARAAGDEPLEMEALMGQAWTHLRLGRLDEADVRASQVIELGDRIGVPYITSFALLTRGVVRAAKGHVGAALGHYGDALRRAHSAGAHVGTALALDAIASAALDRGDVDRGIRLSSAADRLRKDIGGNVTLSQIGLDEPLGRAQRMVGRDHYEREVKLGRALSADQAVAMGLEELRAR
jgi:predicted ATPase/class 3 adenylate cyclase